MSEARPLRIALIAGEPSGDVLGAGLMRALREQTSGNVVFQGVGGAQMIAEGLQSLFPIADLSVMGLVEILPRARLLLRRIDQTARFIQDNPPDVVVTIDSPGFTRRVAQRLFDQRVSEHRFPLVHYVAPTVWAWRPKRAERLTRLYDHLMVLLPFEPPYFEAVGLKTTFVGHPAVETLARARQAEAAAERNFRERHGIAPDARLLALLPGSRKGEVNRLLPVFTDVLRQLKAHDLNLHLLVPTVETVAPVVKAAAPNLPMPATVIEAPAERYAAMIAAEAALAASGTATLELGLAETPTVLAYKVNPITAAIVRRLIRTPYAGLVNILQQREVMPEFLQERCRPELITPALLRLLTEPAARQAQIDACRAVAVQLGSAEAIGPSARAARAVLAMVAGGKG
ncbi:lipid-A-disaccharide synthase [uncultured Ferrovibrio sp.]|jgi:lipid-A-disaccharide synthase|uniref:lipid-A-disaccharide synthase n=1 Tax=uncultured Ferrovibrio sp. TaxID=1576913 RepID=UPI0026130134|nr:lipid-A-disaccharide synthase [uncultured Ferrovibrio sp.]